MKILNYDQIITLFPLLLIQVVKIELCTSLLSSLTIAIPRDIQVKRSEEAKFSELNFLSERKNEETQNTYPLEEEKLI